MLHHTHPFTIPLFGSPLLLANTTSSSAIRQRVCSSSRRTLTPPARTSVQVRDMAWMCSGNSNADLVGRLARERLVVTEAVEQAMLAVDRGHFSKFKPYEVSLLSRHSCFHLTRSSQLNRAFLITTLGLATNHWIQLDHLCSTHACFCSGKPCAFSVLRRQR